MVYVAVERGEDIFYIRPAVETILSWAQPRPVRQRERAREIARCARAFTDRSKPADVRFDYFSAGMDHSRGPLKSGFGYLDILVSVQPELGEESSPDALWVASDMVQAAIMELRGDFYRREGIRT